MCSGKCFIWINGNRRKNFDGVERQTPKAFGACIFYGSHGILQNVLALSAMCVQQLHSNDNLNNDRKSNNNSYNNRLNGRTKKRTVVHKAKSKTIEIDSRGKPKWWGWCRECRGWCSRWCSRHIKIRDVHVEEIWNIGYLGKIQFKKC